MKEDLSKPPTFWEKIRLFFAKEHLFTDSNEDGTLLVRVKFLPNKTYLIDQRILQKNGACQHNSEAEDHH
jgi:hypothetical protein